jgi:hypothetical protein
VDGRVSFPKEFKKKLFELSKGKCAVCNGEFAERYLQIDHKMPYEVGGDTIDGRNIEDFMLLCGSCNRAKSWSCEHCENWKTDKNTELCIQCYWGNPANYNHIAMQAVRRLDLQWEGEDVKNYDSLKVIAEDNEIDLPDFVKQILADKLK